MSWPIIIQCALSEYASRRRLNVCTKSRSANFVLLRMFMLWHRTRDHDLERAVELVNSRHNFSACSLSAFIRSELIKIWISSLFVNVLGSPILHEGNIYEIFQREEMYTHHMWISSETDFFVNLFFLFFSEHNFMFSIFSFKELISLSFARLIVM